MALTAKGWEMLNSMLYPRTGDKGYDNSRRLLKFIDDKSYQNLLARQLSGENGTLDAKEIKLIKRMAEQVVQDRDAKIAASIDKADKLAAAEAEAKHALAEKAGQDASGLGGAFAALSPHAAIIRSVGLAAGQGLNAHAEQQEAKANALASAILRNASASTGLRNPNLNPVTRGMAAAADNDKYFAHRNATWERAAGNTLAGIANIVSGGITAGNTAKSFAESGGKSAALLGNINKIGRMSQGLDAYGRSIQN